MKNVLTIEQLRMEKEAREKALKLLMNKNENLMELAVWEELGTPFEMILPGFMTYKEVSKLFDTQVVSIKKHFKKSSVNYDELIEAGVKHYSVAEFKELQDTLNVSSGTAGTDRKIKINNTGVVLIPLPAVIKLGMFMTGTEKAVEFRTLVVLELAQGVETRQALEVTTNNLLSQLVAESEQGLIISKANIRKSVIDVTSQTKLVKRDSLINTKESLTTILNNYRKIVDVKKEELSKIQDDMSTEYYLLESEIEEINDLIYVLLRSINKVQDVLNKFVTKVLSSVDNNLVYNLSDPFLAVYPEFKTVKEIDRNKALSELKKKLTLAGYMKEEVFTSTKTKKIKVDANGNEIKKLAKGQQYFTKEVKTKVNKVMYVPAEGREWVFNKQVGEITSTKAAQTFKLSKYGFELFKKLFEEIKNCDEKGLDYKNINITKSDFESHYVSNAEL